MKRILVLFAVIFAFACSQNAIDEGAPQAGDKAVEKQAPAAEVAQPAGEQTPKEKVISVPQEVAQKYKSLIVKVSEKKTNKEIETEVLLGAKAEVSGTPLSVEIEHYLPDFIMDEAGKMTSRSLDENNPAAKVKVYKNGELAFDGWIFTNFPDIHPFEDADYNVQVKNSVKK